MKRFLRGLFLAWAGVAALATGLSCASSQSATTPKTPYGLPDGLYSEITTTRGVVVCQLYYTKTPMTVASYVGLAEGTLGPQPRKPFFDGSPYHRVVTNFVVQGGQGADGRGAGYSFPDEFVPGLRHDSVGVLQMANDGPDSNGSQHCLMLSAQNRLNYEHTVFGHVVRGMEVLPQIQQADKTHQGDKMITVRILRIGPAAQAFHVDEESFKAMVAKAPRYVGPRRPGPDASFDDPDTILPTDIPRALHFNYKLTSFTRVNGVKFFGRVFAITPAGSVDDYVRDLATRLGVAQQGALAVYFADHDDWRIWIGDGTAKAFSGKETLDTARENFLADARKRAAAFVETAQQAAGADHPLTAGQKIKFQVDAVLDGMIFKLEPK
jgi:cyclophilin family peptidyl-prolyl cis-trans isomerase